MNAVIYCRKSTEDKNRQVQSIVDQERECMKIVEDRGLKLIAKPFKESKTAKLPEVRYEFYKMLELVKSGKADTIVVWDASRLARNAMDGGQIIHLIDNYNLKIIAPYTEYNSSNSFMLFIEFGMATDFSKKLSHNVKRGLHSKAEKGYYPGPAPLGYRNLTSEIRGNSTIVPRESEFGLCRKWWELMLTGKYTVESSLKEITLSGLRWRSKPVTRSAAYRFFRNPFYYGKFRYAGEVLQGSHTPMVSFEEFNRIQTMINRRETPAKDVFMEFGGFIKCGECGATITAEPHTKTYKNGTSEDFNYYRCTKKLGKCSQRYIRDIEINKQINEYLGTLELHPAYIDWVRGVLKRRNQEEFEYERKQKDDQTRRLKGMLDRKEKLYSMKLDGLITPEQYQAKKSEILKEEDEIKQLLSRDRTIYWEKVIDETLDFAGKVTELFNHGDKVTRRLVLQIIGSNLVLKDKKLIINTKGAFLFLKQNEKQMFDAIAKLEPVQKTDTQLYYLHPDSDIFISEAAGTRTQNPQLKRLLLYH